MLDGIITQIIIAIIVYPFLYGYIARMIYITLVIGINWMYIGGYLRPEKFSLNKYLKNDSLDLENKKYYFKHYFLLNIMLILLFTTIGLFIFISNHTITFALIIGICLQTLLWFPDKINKIWPWNLKTRKGIISLTISIIILTIILIKCIVMPEYMLFIKILYILK